MAIILDGKETARKVRESLKTKVEELKQRNIFPRLAVIMVGDDKASQIYVKNKKVKQQVKGAGFKGKILIR